MSKAVLKKNADGTGQRWTSLCNKFQQDAVALEAETEELWPQIGEALEAAVPEFDPLNMPEPRPATPPDTPLFDSRRDYLDQTDHYRRWQGKGGASCPS